MKIRLFFLFSFSFFLLMGCEVEFSPNAEWKNVPAVYCLLDQDDDTTWVRVQRCYLTEGNIYDYGLISDSINYPQGAITVTLYAYNDGVLKDTMLFQYTERQIDTGRFAHTNQPLYWFETRNRLREEYSYVLTVRNATDGSILATTDPVNLIKRTSSDRLFSKPSLVILNGTDTISGGFAFFDNTGSTSTTLFCHMKWNPLENARLYQPIVRFYYRVEGVTKYVDLKCPAVSSKNSETYYSRDLFLNELKNQLQADTSRKQYIPYVDLYLTCCSEDLNAYLSTVTSGASLSQNTEVYNNIRGGVGVFASRRTHLFMHMPSDNSSGPRGLLTFLSELGVGLY